jgi:hypothetical protein
MNDAWLAMVLTLGITLGGATPGLRVHCCRSRHPALARGGGHESSKLFGRRPPL